MIKKLSSAVKGLTASTYGWTQFNTNSSTFQAIPTVVGVASNTQVGAFMFPSTSAFSIAQGDGENQRQGNYLKVKYIDIRYQIRQPLTQPVTQNGGSCAVRVLLICTHTPNGQPGVGANATAPSMNDIFAFVTGSGVTMARGDLMHAYNPDQRDRHHIYYDRIHQFFPPTLGAGVSAGGEQYMSHGRIKAVPTKKNSVQKYNNTTGTITGVEQNLWYLLVFSDNATTSDATPPEISLMSCMSFEQ